jgi:hypothetical protein
VRLWEPQILHNYSSLNCPHFYTWACSTECALDWNKDCRMCLGWLSPYLDCIILFPCHIAATVTALLHLARPLLVPNTVGQIEKHGIYLRMVFFALPGSQESVVSVAAGYGLDNWGVRVQTLVGSRIFSSPHHADWLWYPPSLLSNWSWGLFPQE